MGFSFQDHSCKQICRHLSLNLSHLFVLCPIILLLSASVPMRHFRLKRDLPIETSYLNFLNNRFDVYTCMYIRRIARFSSPSWRFLRSFRFGVTIDRFNWRANISPRFLCYIRAGHYSHATSTNDNRTVLVASRSEDSARKGPEGWRGGREKKYIIIIYYDPQYGRATVFGVVRRRYFVGFGPPHRRANIW